MHLIEDSAEGFVATYVPAWLPLYEVGDGEDSTLKVCANDKLFAYGPDRFYRAFHITYDPPPIPDRRWDYSYVHYDYGGEGDPRHGHAASVEACKREIDEMYDEGA